MKGGKQCEFLYETRREAPIFARACLIIGGKPNSEVFLPDKDDFLPVYRMYVQKDQQSMVGKDPLLLDVLIIFKQALSQFLVSQGI